MQFHSGKHQGALNLRLFCPQKQRFYAQFPLFGRFSTDYRHYFDDMTDCEASGSPPIFRFHKGGTIHAKHFGSPVLNPLGFFEGVNNKLFFIFTDRSAELNSVFQNLPG